jgi:GTP-binding protein LepA
MVDGKQIELHNPADMPDTTLIKTISEPWIKATYNFSREIFRHNN